MLNRFFGNRKANMDAVCDYAYRGEKAGDNMGPSLNLFDIDNDGFDDVVIAARYAKKYRGAVYIWWGGENLDGNRRADIFNWDTTNASPGKHTLKVEIPPVPGEQNTEDNCKTVVIEVKGSS